MNNGFQQKWAEIKKLWNHALRKPWIIMQISLDWLSQPHNCRVDIGHEIISMVIYIIPNYLFKVEATYQNLS